MVEWIFDRIIKNWKTSTKFLAPVIVGVLANKGLEIPVETVTLYLSGVYGLILLFSKDASKIVEK